VIEEAGVRNSKLKGWKGELVSPWGWVEFTHGNI